MEEKVVFITGGSSGIGKSIGVFLKSKGHKVIGTTRFLDQKQSDSAIELVSMDVTVTSSIRSAIATTMEKHGRIDVLINNAGIGITGPVEETPGSEVNKVMKTNFSGPVQVMQAVLPHMRQAQQGLIINITSIAGFMGLPYRGVYSASKGALELITEAMRIETKDFGVKITNLAPGDFATNIADGRYHAPVKEDSPYKKPYKNTLDNINAHVELGSDPIEVGRKVLKIMETPNPRIHYKVGKRSQKMSVFLKHILPDKWYERLLINHYKL
ncbi:MAG: SDR family oxidoreductase [Eudoraea sp.]|nr:SDR family oxidoreductase [Eudoraea sp.]